MSNIHRRTTTPRRTSTTPQHIFTSPPPHHPPHFSSTHLSSPPHITFPPRIFHHPPHLPSIHTSQIPLPKRTAACASSQPPPPTLPRLIVRFPPTPPPHPPRTPPAVDDPPVFTDDFDAFRTEPLDSFESSTAPLEPRSGRLAIMASMAFRRAGRRSSTRARVPSTSRRAWMCSAWVVWEEKNSLFGRTHLTSPRKLYAGIGKREECATTSSANGSDSRN